ncbi:MAG: transcriptional repressor [Rhizobacter sp.]|nr:transcriptional repressor [Bacteriovorax sp.]
MSLLNPKKEQEREALCATLLKEKGLSVTAPRKLILGLLLKEHGPFSAEEIQKKLPKNSCDQATIYRCLNQFVETQLVNTSFLEKDMAHFEYNDPHHHHHHIICKICKKIESFHECLMEKIETNLLRKGYKDIQHRLEFFAVCETCAKG